MRRTKIAPALTQVSAFREDARAELRALLAVVRAAEATIRMEEKLGGATILSDPSAFHPRDVTTARALARLRRASHPGEER
jgi:hypothetical protein